MSSENVTTINIPLFGSQMRKDLAKAIEEMGNPFTENSNDLFVLDSRDLADPATIDSVHKIENLEQE